MTKPRYDSKTVQFLSLSLLLIILAGCTTLRGPVRSDVLSEDTISRIATCSSGLGVSLTPSIEAGISRSLIRGVALSSKIETEIRGQLLEKLDVSEQRAVELYKTYVECVTRDNQVIAQREERIVEILEIRFERVKEAAQTAINAGCEWDRDDLNNCNSHISLLDERFRNYQEYQEDNLGFLSTDYRIKTCTQTNLLIQYVRRLRKEDFGKYRDFERWTANMCSGSVFANPLDELEQRFGVTASVAADGSAQALVLVSLGGNKTISDADIVELSPILKKLPSLQSLTLRNTNIGDMALPIIVQALPSLSHLDLGNTRITASGLDTLREFSGLAVLHIDGTNTIRNSLDRLSAMPALRFVHIESDLTANELRIFNENLRSKKSELTILR